MIEVKFRLWKRDFVWLGLIVVLLGLGGVYAYNSGLDPSIMGHSAEEIEVTDEFCAKISGHACGYDKEGVAGPDLVNGLRSSSQCTSSGGSVVSVSEGKVCRFSGASCPSGGWTRFKSYSSTSSNSCYSPQGASSYNCATGGHAFANIGQESCNYIFLQHINRYTKTCYATVTSVGCY